MPLKFDFSLLHATQTSYGIVYLKGKKINEYLSINYYQSLERERKDQYQLKTKQTNKQKSHQTTSRSRASAPWFPVAGRGGDVVMGTVMSA